MTLVKHYQHKGALPKKTTIRKPKIESKQDGCLSTLQPLIDPPPQDTETGTRNDKTNDREKENDFNVSVIPHDPRLRINILDYNPNVQDVVRSEYTEIGHCRPRSHNFPQTKFGVKSRRFNLRWFNKNKDDHVEDVFVKNGFSGWNRPITFDKHVSKFNSVHNQAREKYDAINKPKASIQNLFDSRKKGDTNIYRACLRALLCYFKHSSIMYVGGVSYKRNEPLKDAQAQNVAQTFNEDEYASGKGKNQGLGLGSSGDTRWGSHYKLINNVISLYSNPDDQLNDETVSYALESFEFVFLAHLMKKLFAVANDLNYALQKKDQDTVEAMSLVELTKERLQIISNDG
nr:hypothetical protein [Tanacetum cinerariifolium]GEY77023.1 hypothetical protein [Tanacetum cinerariifolium]